MSRQQRRYESSQTSRPLTHRQRVDAMVELIRNNGKRAGLTDEQIDRRVRLYHDPQSEVDVAPDMKPRKTAVIIVANSTIEVERATRESIERSAAKWETIKARIRARYWREGAA